MMFQGFVYLCLACDLPQLPSHYIFPQLHIEIGLVNNILESFNDFVEEQVEVAPLEE